MLKFNARKCTLLKIILIGLVQALFIKPVLANADANTEPASLAAAYATYDALLARGLRMQGSLALFDYQAFASQPREWQQLLSKLLALEPNKLSRPAQKAFWLNLYNVATIVRVLEYYPVESIRDIRAHWYNLNPWQDAWLELAGQSYSLADIEHAILRVEFDDARIHYALNCASIGCPNLAAKAYRAKQLDKMLDEQARVFINSDRALSIKGSTLRLSSIYKWFYDDFEKQAKPEHASQRELVLIEHWLNYVKGAKREALTALYTAYQQQSTQIGLEYSYNWQLNAAQ